jgi:hypothetical protein
MRFRNLPNAGVGWAFYWLAKYVLPVLGVRHMLEENSPQGGVGEREE